MAKQSRRRAKGRGEFNRPAASREERDKVLIVCEGEKTEPSYFENLRKELRLTSAKVKVTGDCGSAPTSVVDCAAAILKKDDDFEQIYLVFDRDGAPQRANYEQAIAKVAGMASRQEYKNKRIMAITSIPCFEVWYMLHLKPNSRPYEDAEGGGSPAKELISDLKGTALNGSTPFAKYQKSDCASYFDLIAPKREGAKKNAARILRQASDRGDPEHQENPSTRVHIIVDALEKLSTS